jgi:hypothetical protein
MGCDGGAKRSSLPAAGAGRGSTPKARSIWSTASSSSFSVEGGGKPGAATGVA